MASSWLPERIFCSGRPARRSALAMASLPSAMASSRRSFVNHWRILVRARGVTTTFSQSRLGPLVVLEVTICTVSPEES